jgi:3-phosphoglycerate kinase
MTQVVERVHFVDRQMLARLTTVVMLVLIGGGIVACFAGALAYDVGRLFSAW